MCVRNAHEERHEEEQHAPTWEMHGWKLDAGKSGERSMMTCEGASTQGK